MDSDEEDEEDDYMDNCVELADKQEELDLSESDISMRNFSRPEVLAFIPPIGLMEP